MRWTLLMMLTISAYLAMGCSESTSPEKGEKLPVEHASPLEGASSEKGEFVEVKTPEDQASITKNSNPSLQPLEALRKATETITLRSDVSSLSKVKHILMGWRQLSPAYKGKMDPRAGKRTRAEANQLISEIIGKLEGGADFSALMKEHSEDSSSLESGKPYVVTPTAGFVPPFKNVSLRLKKKERALVESVYGWHLIERVE